MANNDSEFSDVDGSIYNTTTVLLGYSSKEATDDSFSQLGGYPSWPEPSNPPSSHLARCRTCNDLMTLLLQLNGDLPERFSGHERRLYVFSCKRKTCRRKQGSIRAIRGSKIAKGSLQSNQRKESQSTSQTREAPQPVTNLGSSIFSSNFQPQTATNQNPFASSADQTQRKSANPFSDAPSNAASSTSKESSDKQSEKLTTLFSEKARISAPENMPKGASTSTAKAPWPKQSELPPPYPSSHLDADYEALDSTPPGSSQQESNMAIDETNDPGAEKETFESSIDKTFQRFADRLAQNPEQILRYEFGGRPLLYSNTDTTGQLFSSISPSTSSSSNAKVKTVAAPGSSAKGIPACPACNAPRVFELQLTPHAIAELEAEEASLEGMDWGTVILGVCSRDCGDAGASGEEMWSWKEEWVGVQWEELMEKGRR